MNDKIFIMLFLAFVLNIHSKDMNKLNKKLIEAVSGNNISKVQKLINEGVNVNAKDDLGWTALHWSSIDGFKDIAQLLINSGANVNIQEDDGETPLHFSIQNKDNIIVKMFLKAGADINIKDNQGKTALDIAVNEIETDMVKLLLELGANPNTKDVQSNEALHIAVSSNNKEIVKMLIEAAASIGGRNEQNNTPLELAIAENNSEIEKLLGSVSIVESNLSRFKEQPEDIKKTLVKRWINQYLRYKDEKLIQRLHVVPKYLLGNIIDHMLETLKQSKAISQDDAIRINKKESMLRNLLLNIDKKIFVGFEDVNIVTQGSKKRPRESVEFEKLKKIIYE